MLTSGEKQMNKSNLRNLALRSFLILAPVLFLQSCGTLSKINPFGGKKTTGLNNEPLQGIRNGEVMATARKGFKQTAPAGMVLIPSGSFTMGQADEDVLSSRVTMNKRVTIVPFYMDDTEITNMEYRQFVEAMLMDSVSTLGEEFIMTSLYPDTTVWRKDFTFHNGDQMTEYYFTNPAFDMYPVVGISWDAAQKLRMANQTLQ